MAIAASSVTPTNSLEDFRIEFNNLVSDVTGITATNKFTENIIFEGATADAYETTLTVTDPTADRTITLPNLTGTLIVDGNPGTADGGTLGTTALEWSDLYLADGAVIYFGADQDVTLTHNADTSLTLNLMMAATTFEPTGDTAAGDNAAIGYTSAEGLILTGQGSTSDITLKNDADATVFTVPTGTDDILFPDGAKIRLGASGDLEIYHDGSNSYIVDGGTGNLKIYANQLDIIGTAETLATFTDDGAVTLYYDNTVALATASAAVNVTGDLTATLTIQPAGDTATGDNAAIGYTSAEGLILTGQGSTNDVTIKNDADGDVISIPTGTTNVTIAGDLTISGDDLFMGTNTSGAALIADGTNYNPVVISGDATIATNGALTIAATSVEGSMLNTNVISGQTALTTAVATTDELLISDAGTLKRVDVSLITDLATGDATALAIALG